MWCFLLARRERSQANCFQMGVWRGHVHHSAEGEESAQRERKQWGSVKSILLYWRGHFLSGFWGIKCVCVLRGGIFAWLPCGENNKVKDTVQSCTCVISTSWLWCTLKEQILNTRRWFIIRIKDNSELSFEVKSYLCWMFCTESFTMCLMKQTLDFPFLFFVWSAVEQNIPA